MDFLNNEKEIIDPKMYMNTETGVHFGFYAFGYSGYLLRKKGEFLKDLMFVPLCCNCRSNITDVSKCNRAGKQYSLDEVHRTFKKEYNCTYSFKVENKNFIGKIIDDVLIVYFSNVIKQERLIISGRYPYRGCGIISNDINTIEFIEYYGGTLDLTIDRFPVYGLEDLNV